MSKKRWGKLGLQHKNGFAGKKTRQEPNSRTNPNNPHEQDAEKILLELKNKDKVFGFVERNNSIDSIGIDWVVGRHVKVSKHSRKLRVHIQHKVREKDAAYFRDRNPCIPVWIHHQSTSALDGKINVLKIIVKALGRVSSSHIDFFKEKLEYFENLQKQEASST